MKKSIWIAVIFAASAFANEPDYSRRESLSSGGKEGHGGDVAACKTGSTELDYQPLDKIIAEGRNADGLQSYKSTQEYLDAIQNKLDSSYPELGASLKYFLDNYKKTVNRTQKRTDSVYWMSAGYGLVDYKDENLNELLPEKCKDLIQAAFQETRVNHQRVYKYSPKVFSYLDSKSTLSWLLIHEWLWDFAENAEIVRELNEYLHSKDFLTDGENQIWKTFRTLRMGGNTPLRSKSFLDQYMPVVTEFQKRLSSAQAVYERQADMEKRGGCSDEGLNLNAQDEQEIEKIYREAENVEMAKEFRYQPEISSIFKQFANLRIYSFKLNSKCREKRIQYLLERGRMLLEEATAPKHSDNK